ncbi:MAG: hypothetical protein GC159_14390 [Phycisphaera sp.]|nr:hypothetical protein [Phycisphaera sp.]
MPWQLRDVQPNRHNDNYTVTVEYRDGGEPIAEHTGQVGPTGLPDAFIRAARQTLTRVRHAEQRKADDEQAGRFAAIVDRLNAG